MIMWWVRMSSQAPASTDPHPVWLKEWLRLEERVAQRYGVIAGCDPIPARVEELYQQCAERMRLIAFTPPTSAGGAAAQLELMHTIYFAQAGTNDAIFRACLESVISFLKRVDEATLEKVKVDD